MVKIRLQRIGAKKKPIYRVVVVDARAPRSGAVIDVVGHYDPRTEPSTVEMDEEKTLLWLSRGAQATATAARLMAKAGIDQRFRIQKEAAATA